jgi:predicted transcriptional regulator
MLQQLPDSKVESDETRFTNDELIQAFFNAQPSAEEDSDVLRMEELAEIMSMSRSAVMWRVKLLLKAGVIEVAEKRFIDMMGRQTRTMGYRLVK